MSLTEVGEKHFSVVNHCVPRTGGADKVTGRVCYAADIYMEGMLYAGALRGPYFSARIVSVDAVKARAIPGVEAIVTCFDMPRTRSRIGYMYLADTIRYSGDRVAMVAAQSKELVDEVLEAIHAEYRELPGAYTTEEALGEGASMVHEKYPDNIFKDPVFHIRKGDSDTAFEKADIVLEREYGAQYIEHSYIESEACTCYLNPNDGAMTVHSVSQNPFFTRRYVVDVPRVPMNQVRMVQKTLGGTLGSKEEGAGPVAGRCAYLCSLTKKPVKFVFNREDSFLESAKRHPFRLRYKAGITKDGRIVVWQSEQMDNCGAYNDQIQFMNWGTNVHSAGPYGIDNIKTDTYGVFTNNVRSGAVRGYSSPQLIWAQEQFIEELVTACGMDELGLRRKNLLHDGALTATGVPVEHCVIQGIMDATAEQTGYKEKRAAYLNQSEGSRKRRDIGLAVCRRGSGLGAESPDASRCMVICNEDGSVMINSGLAENGQGLKIACAQIAAGALSMSHEAIRFFGTDTHSIPDRGMIVASRGTVVGAQPVRKTGEKLRGVMIQNALELHSLPSEEIEKAYDLKKGTLDYSRLTADQVELLDSQFHLKKHPDVKVPLSDVCNACLRTGKQMVAFEWFKPQNLIQDHETGQGEVLPTFAYDYIAAEVEVDMKTGYMDVLEVTVSHDVGTAINLALVKGQTYGGIVMGQGFTVIEDVVAGKRGQKTKNFDSYILPTSVDVPKMNINIYENQDPTGTYGAESIGEPATEGVGATIANAIFNAIGRRVYENPADLETVLLGHRLQQKGDSVNDSVQVSQGRFPGRRSKSA